MAAARGHLYINGSRPDPGDEMSKSYGGEETRFKRNPDEDGETTAARHPWQSKEVEKVRQTHPPGGIPRVLLGGGASSGSPWLDAVSVEKATKR